MEWRSKVRLTRNSLDRLHPTSSAKGGDKEEQTYFPFGKGCRGVFSVS